MKNDIINKTNDSQLYKVYDKFCILYFVANILSIKYSIYFYKVFLEKYNSLIEKISFGIKQHTLVKKN